MAGCDHPTEIKAIRNVAAMATGVIGGGLVVWAIVAFLMAAAGAPKTNSPLVGILLTVIFSTGSLILSIFFWLVAGDSATGFGFGGGWGRPLRIRGGGVTPRARRAHGWTRGQRPAANAIERLDPEARALLRDMWLHDANKEWGSVPAFAHVAWQLVAVAAPPDLVQRALRSAQQEIDHTRRCFAMASAYAGEELGPSPMEELAAGGDALPKDRLAALGVIAEESLVDGAYVEDYNAELAAAALGDVEDAAARETLECIVRDERQHAELAWDIVAFCIDQGGDAVRERLRRAWKERVPAEAPLPYGRAIADRVARIDEEALYVHGRVRPGHWPVVHRARVAVLSARLEALLAARPKALVSARREARAPLPPAAS